MIRSRFNYKNHSIYFFCFLNLFMDKPVYFFIDFETSFTFKPWDFLVFKNLNKFLLKRPLFFKKIFLKKLFLKKIFKINNKNILINLITF